MIKKIHLIKEDYPGDIEQYCLETFKRDYPDFEFVFWKPGSSPLRILYDNGGLFIGPGLISMSRLPDSFFDKSFLVFDNVFESTLPNINLCCYSDKEQSPIFMEFMEKGIFPALKEKKGLSDKFELEAPRDKLFSDINIFYWDKIIGFDKLSKEVTFNKPFYLLDTNTQKEEGDWHVHYLVVDENTNPSTVYTLCENYSEMEYDDGTNHFMLIVCNDIKHDLANRLSTFLHYKTTVKANKSYNIIAFDNLEETKLYKFIVEYISRRFNKVLSCENLN